VCISSRISFELITVARIAEKWMREKPLKDEMLESREVRVSKRVCLDLSNVQFSNSCHMNVYQIS